MFHSDNIQEMVSLTFASLLYAKGRTTTFDASHWRIIPRMRLKSQCNSNRAHYIAALRNGYIARCAFKWKNILALFNLDLCISMDFILNKYFSFFNVALHTKKAMGKKEISYSFSHPIFWDIIQPWEINIKNLNECLLCRKWN